MLDRWHRTLKTALMGRDDLSWSRILPFVLLRVRTAIMFYDLWKGGHRYFQSRKTNVFSSFQCQHHRLCHLAIPSLLYFGILPVQSMPLLKMYQCLSTELFQCLLFITMWNIANPHMVFVYCSHFIVNGTTFQFHYLLWLLLFIALGKYVPALIGRVSNPGSCWSKDRPLSPP